MSRALVVGAALSTILVACATPSFADSGVAKIEALLDEGNYTQAIVRIERESSLPEGRRAYLLTRAYLGERDWKQAVGHGKRAAALIPDDVDAQLVYAEALRIKMQAVSKVRAMMSVGKYKAALARALELDPDNVEARTEQIGYLTHAPGIAGGDKKLAQKRILELEKIDFARAMQMQAQLSRATGDDDGWLRAMRRLAEHEPENEAQRLRLAIVLIHLERYDEADPLLLEIVGSEDRQTSLGATYQLGRLRVLGEYDVERGIEYFQRYLAEIGEAAPVGLPSRAAAYWRLGEGRALEGDVEGARAALRESLRLDPDLAEAKSALEKLGG